MLREACEEKRSILKIANSLLLLLLALSTLVEALNVHASMLSILPRDVVTVHGLSSHLIVTEDRFSPRRSTFVYLFLCTFLAPDDEHLLEF
jgi:hypothetical protein